MKKRVLIVDDDASVRESAGKVLRAENYEVVTAADGQTALERFEAGGIDLLLLDLGLPIKHGWDVFERITNENPLVPIIVITGQTNQYPLAVAAGVGALMEKPLDVSQLLKTIQELLAEPAEMRLHRLCGYLNDVPHSPAESTKLLKTLRAGQAAQSRVRPGPADQPVQKKLEHSQKPVRIILADHHALVRAGVRALLEKLPGVEVVCETSESREVLNLVKRHRPDVVFMALAMPGLNGLDTTTRIIREFTGIRVIILAMECNEEYCWQALKAGAAGYLLKKTTAAELATALERVLHGEIYVCRDISTRIPSNFSGLGTTIRESPFKQLTDRQREVLQLIAEGQNTKQIGEILKVSPKTVEYHRTKLMDCLNLHDIPSLVRYALRVGMVPEEMLVTP
jgi:DNA-binding NarL/FixJ family response regulator